MHVLACPFLCMESGVWPSAQPFKVEALESLGQTLLSEATAGQVGAEWEQGSNVPSSKLTNCSHEQGVPPTPPQLPTFIWATSKSLEGTDPSMTVS